MMNKTKELAVADFDHNRIVNLTAEGDRNTSLQIGVYMGNASISVFSNKSKAAGFSLPRTAITFLKEAIVKAIQGKPGDKVSIDFSKYDFESKKNNPLGQLIVGRDDKAMIYLGVRVPNQAPMKFPMKSPGSFDLSDPMSDSDRSILAAKTIVDQLAVDIPTAMMLTSVKRTTAPGGGFGSGSRSGGGDGDIFGG